MKERREGGREGGILAKKVYYSKHTELTQQPWEDCGFVFSH